MSLLRHKGQRLLLAFQSNSGDDYQTSFEESSIVSGLLLSLAGLVCFAVVLINCVCGKSAKNHTDENGKEDVSGKKGRRRSSGLLLHDEMELKEVVSGTTVMDNGGVTSNRNSILSGHSRQASSGSAHNMRPTNLRELPEPPVTAHHSRNTSAAGIIEHNSENIGEMDNGGMNSEGVGGGDFTHHHYQEPHPRTTGAPGGNNSNTAKKDTSTEMHNTSNDGYDHLGMKPNIKPADYDSLATPEEQDDVTPVLEPEAGTDGHYSQPRERMYAVVNDVKKKKDMYDPYSHVRDGDDNSSQTGSNIYSQMKDEDPYNHIGDSDGALSATMIHQIQTPLDLDDPYATLQDDETGEFTAGSQLQVAVGGALSRHTTSSIPKRMVSPRDSDGADEYAVVKKVRPSSATGSGPNPPEENEQGIQPYSMGPQEPPRNYDEYGDIEVREGEVYGESDSSRLSREHKYSKVTARESLASMSARNALNPYEMVPDLTENMYATVEGGSGDGVVGNVTMSRPGNNLAGENRLSQNSDTYAEIAISGGGLTNSVISSSSTTSSNYNNSGAPTSSNYNNSGAPIPPSLDSLHMMTKSQTSSEGDRLSDRMSERHLASPEDSALGMTPWADGGDVDWEGSVASSEGGYSTLKRPRSEVGEGGEVLSLNSPLKDVQLQRGGQNLNRDALSGEITLVPNYQTVKDSISDSEQMDDLENDPNYESVDEARAKVAALKVGGKSTVSSSTTHKTQIIHGGGPVLSENLTLGKLRQARLQQPDHDYEEVDISPPMSPSEKPLSLSLTSTSSYTPSSQSPVIVLSNPNHSSNDAGMAEARERIIQSHLYEELPNMRARKYEEIREPCEENMTSSNGKVISSDKKKHTSEKKQSMGEDAKKNRSSSEKKKSGSAQAGFTRL